MDFISLNLPAWINADSTHIRKFNSGLPAPIVSLLKRRTRMKKHSMYFQLQSVQCYAPFYKDMSLESLINLLTKVNNE